MKLVRSLKNQYRGVNAHLHSFWQGQGGWNSFHSNHITHLLTLMKTQLRPMGYTADVSQSLQIRRYEEPAGKPESDVTIYDLNPSRPVKPVFSAGGAQELVLPLPQILGLGEPTEKQYDAVVIYSYERNRRSPGEPVAWVELLSPSNKPGGQDAEQYAEKRLKILESGIVLVEIDYLHETPTTLEGIPAYRPARQPELAAHPYRIAVIDPRPVFWQGVGRITEFDVDAPIPTIEIPLNAGDVLKFDFGAPYRKTFEEILYGDDVDYRQLPLNVDRYSQADQARIVARMLAVLKATREGIDLDANAPLPVEPVTLADGLKQLEAIQA